MHFPNKMDVFLFGLIVVTCALFQSSPGEAATVDLVPTSEEFKSACFSGAASIETFCKRVSAGCIYHKDECLNNTISIARKSAIESFTYDLTTCDQTLTINSGTVVYGAYCKITCQNEGICYQSGPNCGSYKCKCGDGYSGDFCETKITNAATATATAAPIITTSMSNRITLDLNKSSLTLSCPKQTLAAKKQAECTLTVRHNGLADISLNDGNGKTSLLTGGLKSGTYLGEPFPTAVDRTLPNSYQTSQNTYLLNTIFPYDAYLNGIEIYALKAGSITLRVAFFNQCDSPATCAKYFTDSSEIYPSKKLYSKALTSAKMELKVGYNLIKLNPHVKLTKGQMLYIKQCDAQLAVAKSASSDFYWDVADLSFEVRRLNAYSDLKYLVRPLVDVNEFSTEELAVSVMYEKRNTYKITVKLLNARIPIEASQTVSVYYEDADSYLIDSNVNIAKRDKDQWIELCQLQARQPGGSCCKKKCTATECVSTGKSILETRVEFISENFRCTYSTHTYAAGTDLLLQEKINNKYESAKSLALSDKQTLVAKDIEAKQSEHLLMVKTNMQVAKLSAESCMDKGFYGGGGNCHLRLMGRVRVVDF